MELWSGDRSVQRPPPSRRGRLKVSGYLIIPVFGVNAVIELSAKLNGTGIVAQFIFIEVCCKMWKQVWVRPDETAWEPR